MKQCLTDSTMKLPVVLAIAIDIILACQSCRVYIDRHRRAAVLLPPSPLLCSLLRGGRDLHGLSLSSQLDHPAESAPTSQRPRITQSATHHHAQGAPILMHRQSPYITVQH